MSVQLLDKTRKINRLLHNNNSSKVVFNDICEILNEILASNVLVVSKKGKVLGSGQWKDVEIIHERLIIKLEATSMRCSMRDCSVFCQPKKM